MENQDNVEVQKPETPVVEAKEETLDPTVFLAAITKKDNQITDLNERIDALQGTTQTEKDEKANLQIEMSKLINQRSALEKERDDALSAKATAAEEGTKATSNLTAQLEEAQRTIDEFKLNADKLKADNTKFTVLTNEFPNLVKYARWIESSGNPDDVRASAKAFESARETDLNDFATLTSTSALTRTSGTPTKSSDPLDPEAMRAALDHAYATGGETAYEAKVKEFQGLVAEA